MKQPRKIPPLTETNLQRIIVAAIRRDYPQGIVGSIPNGAAVSSKLEAVKLKAEGLLSGAPDLFVIRPRQRIGWIEMKTGVGVLTKSQELLHPQMLERQHMVHIVRSLTDLWPIIEKWKNEDLILPSS